MLCHFLLKLLSFVVLISQGGTNGSDGRKVVELHISGNGYKKISKQLKIPISTIMAIIKKFKATEDVNNQPGKGRVCTLTPHTVRRIVRLAKESPRITAGEL